MPQYGDMLGEQLGSQAASQGLGGLMDIIFQPWRNQNQQEQNQALLNQQVEAQMRMGKFNREQALQMWHDTNSEAQMKHLKAAGLNPALMYGGGGAGGSTTAGTPAGNVGVTNADARAGGGYTGMNILPPAQVRLMEAQARNLDADTAKKSGVETQLGMTTIEKLKADITNVRAQTALTRIQTGIAAIQKDIAEISQEDITDTLSLNAQKIQQELFQVKNQTDISDATKKTIIDTVKQQYINTVLEGMLKKSGIEINSASIQKMSADIVQRGQEIDIKKFEAEIRANQPSIGEISGGMLNSIKSAIDKLMGIKDSYTSPRKIK